MSKSPYATVKQFVQRHPAFTESGIRHKIFNANTNGLADSGAIIRNGRRIIIHEDKFFDYLGSSDNFAGEIK